MSEEAALIDIAETPAQLAMMLGSGLAPTVLRFVQDKGHVEKVKSLPTEDHAFLLEHLSYGMIFLKKVEQASQAVEQEGEDQDAHIKSMAREFFRRDKDLRTTLAFQGLYSILKIVSFIHLKGDMSLSPEAKKAFVLGTALIDLRERYRIDNMLMSNLQVLVEEWMADMGKKMTEAEDGKNSSPAP